MTDFEMALAMRKVRKHRSAVPRRYHTRAEFRRAKAKQAAARRSRRRVQ